MKGTTTKKDGPNESTRRPTPKRALASTTSHQTSSVFIGVDEAGYGPRLGPLVVASTAFLGHLEHEHLDWWELFHSHVGRAGSRAPFIIDDSKAVLARPGGKTQLAHLVHALLQQVGRKPQNLDELFEALAPGDRDALVAEHWYAPQQPLGHEIQIPLASADVPPTPINLFEQACQSAEVTVLAPAARVVFPRLFNEHLDWSANKADVNLTLVLDLLRTQLQRLPGNIPRVFITVDRLGGRRYYRELVEDLAESAFVFTLSESPTESIYRFDADGREVDIRFRVKGDESSLAVAASSMIAKYLRECCMTGLNTFWRARVPNLEPTAGYEVDARRFLAAVKPELATLALPMASFWRAK